MGHEEQEIELLRKQAAYFFGQKASSRGEWPTNAAPTQSSRISSVRERDISSPSSYQLRRQSRSEPLLDAEDMDFSIPPAMFNEHNDSSYSGSNRRDLPFRFDSSISSGELAALGEEFESLTSSTFHASNTDSPYTGSEQSDVPLNRYAPISPGELHSLGLQANCPRSPSHDPFSCEGLSQQMSTLSVSSSVTNGTKKRGSPDNRRDKLASILEEADSNGRTGKMPSTSSSSTAATDVRLPRFPLWEIGAITQPELRRHSQESEISPLPVPIYSQEAPVTPILKVYGEFRSAVDTDIFPLRQPSFATDCSPAVSMADRQAEVLGRPLDHRLLHHLVHRAQHWLLCFRQDQRAEALSPSIYWSIRSLSYFYADSIWQAEQEGAPRHGSVDDAEWPDPPSGEDTYDWSLVPNWLYDLLNMENLHDWGLRDIRTQRGSFILKG